MQRVKHQLIISLTPSVLSIALVSFGVIVQTEKTDLHSAHWGKIWDNGLIGLDQPLRQLLSRFTSRHVGKATVVYHSPTLIQKVYSFDLEESEASKAGIAQLRDSVGKNRPIESYLLSESDVGESSTTLLVYSEREEQLRSIYAWLNRCDVAAKRLVPSSVSVMAVAKEIARIAPLDSAVFYLGDNVSVIAYSSESGLKVIRSIEIGYRALVDGYIQGVSPKSDDQEENTEQTRDFADRHRAESVLFEHGVPLQPIEVVFALRFFRSLVPWFSGFVLRSSRLYGLGLGARRFPSK